MSGDRLSASHLHDVQKYASNIRNTAKFWTAGEQPEWLAGFLNHCKANVPFYKNRIADFEAQPCISRDDIRKQPWNFVSEKADLNELLVYQTSGSTGAAMEVLFDPVSQACWLPQMQSVLDRYGISIGEAERKVAIALICSQTETLTYASLSTYLNGAGILKLNLNPSDWNDISHRLKYLEKYNPEVLTGDPLAFMQLLDLQPQIRPKALISSAMMLSKGIREKLETYFNAPVLDVYSLTECRNIAVAEGERYRAIRPDLYLEIFNPDADELLPYDERGELVVTGGSNPFLPFIRYRTGDSCSLTIEDGIPYLNYFEARKLVTLYSSEKAIINTIDISRRMTKYSLAGFKLHQYEDLSIEFDGFTNDNIEEEVGLELVDIFGKVPVNIKLNKLESIPFVKTVTYTSEFSNA